MEENRDQLVTKSMKQTSRVGGGFYIVQLCLFLTVTERKLFLTTETNGERFFKGGKDRYSLDSWRQQFISTSIGKSFNETCTFMLSGPFMPIGNPNTPTTKIMFT